MRTTFSAVAFFLCLAGVAYASGITEPIMEPEVIAADTTDTSNRLQVFAALALIAVILGAAGAF